VRGWSATPDAAEQALQSFEATSRYRPKIILTLHGERHPAGPAGPTGLSQVNDGFAQATHLLEAATRFGHRGIVDRRSMALRLPALNDPELGKYLHARWIEPVEAESAIGETLLTSVEAYLSRRRSIPEAAAALSVHVNTLR
jgi:putative transposase